MSRPLKPYVVDEVASPNGLVRTQVLFDRDRKDFFVQIPGGERVHADTIDEVKAKAKELLAQSIAYQWEAIIIVTTGQSWEEKNSGWGGRRGRDGEEGAMVEFSFQRVERSPNPMKAKDWIYRLHAVDFEAKEPTDHDRRERDANKRLLNVWETEGCAVVAYDGPTWVGLLALKKLVDEAHEKLKQLVARKDLADRLRLVGTSAQTPILPAAIERAERKGRR